MTLNDDVKELLRKQKYKRNYKIEDSNKVLRVGDFLHQTNKLVKFYFCKKHKIPTNNDALTCVQCHRRYCKLKRVKQVDLITYKKFIMSKYEYK